MHCRRPAQLDAAHGRRRVRHVVLETGCYNVVEPRRLVGSVSIEGVTVDAVQTHHPRSRCDGGSRVVIIPPSPVVIVLVA